MIRRPLTGVGTRLRGTLQRMRGLRRVRPIPDAERARLEAWVRARLALCASDRVGAMIGACRRLEEAGMTPNEAVTTVTRIAGER